MKKLILFPLFIFLFNFSFSQGGWVYETNPNNEVTSYGTSYSYVGCSFIDVNGDNYVDLFVAPKTIFLNGGNGIFNSIVTLPFNELNSVSGSSSADLDNDGDNDIIIACVPSKVFFNNGTGQYSDSSFLVPDFTLYGSWAVAIGDHNEDQKLDFVFAHANGFHPPASPSECRFYDQSPVGFNPIEISGYPFTSNPDAYTNPYWSDYDLDGDMDLFIASGPVMGIPDYDYCYKNMKVETGNDTLVQMTTELFATQTQDGQCYNFIDYDNDGDFDLCLTNYYSAPTRMYKNNGGVYTTISTPFTTTTTNIANCWGDYDNDGDLDVIITNDNQITRYYRNESGASFTYLPGGFTTPTATNGITNADYDNDGDLDIFTNGIGNNGNTSSVGLYINDTVAGNRNFINLKLIGVASNRSAIGAIVRIRSLINGNPVWQMREVNAQNTFQGQNDLRVHFGLGNSTVVDSLIVTWPSGNIDSLYNYTSGSFYQITEGIGGINLQIKETELLNAGITLFPNPANGIFNVKLSGIEKETFLGYRVINVCGVEVLSSTVFKPEFSINLENCESGIYIVSFQTTKGIISSRIVKI